MRQIINHDNDSLDPSEEYFKKKIYSHKTETETETEEFFPLDTSKPPHY
tara:strand:- start:398 stop:544 length:147 start_codon:yes stop_codon:yes gene_type:complete